MALIKILVLSGNLDYNLGTLDGVQVTVESSFTGVNTFRCVSKASKERIVEIIKNGNFDIIVIRSFIAEGKRDVALEKLDIVKSDKRIKVTIVSGFTLSEEERKPFEKFGVKSFTSVRDVQGYVETLIALKNSI